MISVLIADHRAVEATFKEMESGRGSSEQRRDLADHIISELVRHSVAEEHHLYPTARKTLSEGDDIAQHEVEEHTEAESTMKQLEKTDPSDPQFDELAHSLISSVRHHIHEEENDLFPRLRQSCTEAQLIDLGSKIERAKEIAPTRPHPSAPDHPPMNKAIDTGAGLVDRIRDALTGRQH